MRTLGNPVSSTVARAMALGSLTSAASASESHPRAISKGSSPAKMPLRSVMTGSPPFLIVPRNRSTRAEGAAHGCRLPLMDHRRSPKGTTYRQLAREREMSNQLMAGKRGLIMGLANDKSIAWGIARCCADAGAELAFTYMGDAFKKRVQPLADQLGVTQLFNCDVSDPASIDAAFAEIERCWGRLDFIVHAIGFSDKSELRGRYIDTSRENFAMTMDISVYSFTACTRRAAAMMKDGGA